MNNTEILWKTCIKCNAILPEWELYDTEDEYDKYSVKCPNCKKMFFINVETEDEEEPGEVISGDSLPKLGDVLKFWMDDEGVSD